MKAWLMSIWALGVALLLSGRAYSQEEMSWLEFLDTRISFENTEPLSVREFIEAIQRENPRLNVIVDQRAGDYSLPELKFENIPLRGAFELIRLVSKDSIEVEIAAIDEGCELDMVFVWSNDPIVQTRVLSVAQLLKQINQEDFLSAFVEGFEFKDQHAQPPEFRFHSQTGLLFVKGTEDQVVFAESIVLELQRGIDLSLRGAGTGTDTPAGIGAEGERPSPGGLGVGGGGVLGGDKKD